MNERPFFTITNNLDVAREADLLIYSELEPMFPGAVFHLKPTLSSWQTLDVHIHPWSTLSTSIANQSTLAFHLSPVTGSGENVDF